MGNESRRVQMKLFPALFFHASLKAHQSYIDQPSYFLSALLYSSTIVLFVRNQDYRPISFKYSKNPFLNQVDDPLRCPGDESSSSSRSPRLRLPPCPVRACAGGAGPLRIPLRAARDRVRNARQEDNVHVRMSAGGVELPAQEVRCVS